MLEAVYTRQFERDVKRAKRQGKDLEKLKPVVRALVRERALDPAYRDHRLVGAYTGRRECHLEPDWLLVYKIEPGRVIFERMGSHAELFKK